MKWWEENKQRLVQTNLRSTDAALDRDVLIHRLQEYRANVLLLNTGGLVAFYPTDLPFHYRSPFLGDGDLTGDMVKLCHEQGIRFMARFDFSKIHESVYKEHPDWAYRSASGNVVNYNGFVHTCVNGGFQRERSLDILREVLEHYPIDGVFFNMFGYFTRDYSHTYHGICHCDACQQRFAEQYGLQLPLQENTADPTFQKYQEFKLQTVHEMLDNIRTLVKSFGENIAVSTYTDDCVDIIKHESNTEIHRPYPLWEYSASENIQAVEGTWNDKTISNVCINAVGLDYRFQGVPKQQVQVRLAQALAAGSGMDFCIIGVFEDYPDRKSLQIVQDMYAYHEANEAYYGNFSLIGDVVLLKPGPNPTEDQLQEYFGIFRMLKEDHISFRVVEQKAANEIHFRQCKCVICPNPVKSEALFDLLEIVQKPVLLTGSHWASSTDKAVAEYFGVAAWTYIKEARWSYMSHQPKELFPSLQLTDWSILDGPIVHVLPKKGSVGILEHISAGMFGPPEMCLGNSSLASYVGAITADGQRQLLAFNPGILYKKYGYPEHKQIVMDLVRTLIGQRTISLPLGFEQVEVFVGIYPEDSVASYIIHLVNLNGFNGSTFFDPVLVPAIALELALHENETVLDVYSLVSKSSVSYTYENCKISMNLDLLSSFEAIVVRCSKE